MRPTTDFWKELTWGALGYAPNPAQKEITDWYHNSDAQFALICGGEGAGKSLTSVALMMPCISKPGKYWLVGPDYLQPRAEFEYLHQAFSELGMVADASMPTNPASPWILETKPIPHPDPGQRPGPVEIETKTAYNVARLASFEVAAWLMCEAAQQENGAWLKLLGRSMRQRGAGGFGILSGTLEQGLPWYEDILKRWKGPNPMGARSFSLPSWSNEVLYPGGYNDPKMIALRTAPGMTEDYFLERYGAIPRRVKGAVLPEFDMGTHVKTLAPAEGVPVELAIDPGKNAYAILFLQSIGLVTYVLDRIYTRGKIIHDLIPEVKANPLFALVDKSHAGVIDFAGHQELGQKSQVQLWKEMAGCSLRFRYIPEDMTIQTLRYRFGVANPSEQPLVYFNSHLTNLKAPDGTALDVLAEPELWRWPDKGPKQNERRRPVDANNHAMKALGYYLVDRYGASVERPKLKKAQRFYHYLETQHEAIR